MPELTEQDMAGMGVYDAVLRDFNNRVADPQTHGKLSDMLNIEAIMDVARTPQYKFEGAASAEKFPEFIDKVVKNMGEDLADRLEPLINQGKILYIVDTAWNDDREGTFGMDSKLRIAMPQVRLQVGDQNIAPIGYSIEYSQNTKGRIFTEVISDEADLDGRDTAYSKYTKMSMGWVFPISKGDVPERFFVRELRFDLSKLKRPQGSESIVNQNPSAVAQVVGAPLLPSPEDIAETGPSSQATTSGVKITGTNSYAEVNENLPGAFSGSAIDLDFDKDADPWELKVGEAERVPAGRGGQRSSVRAIWTRNSDRLIRIQLDGNQAKSLYGRAIGLAEGINVLGVRDEGGNFYDCIGFALKRKDRSLHLDIRAGAADRGVSANELPDIRSEEVLMIYFQVPVGTKVTDFVLSGQDQPFEQPLEVTAGRR